MSEAYSKGRGGVGASTGKRKECKGPAREVLGTGGVGARIIQRHSITRDPAGIGRKAVNYLIIHAGGRGGGRHSACPRKARLEKKVCAFTHSALR